MNRAYSKTYFAELFVSISHSFGAGIANEIYSFKWRKTVLCMNNRHNLKIYNNPPQINLWINLCGMIWNFFEIILNRPYTVPAAQWSTL